MEPKARARQYKRHKAEPRQNANSNDFSITSAKTQLHRALNSTRQNEFAMYRDLRDAGLTWIAICAWCDDPAKHGGKRISAFNWARDNAPISKRWLDEHARFAHDWPEFVDCWEWAQKQDHTPDRRPSLRTARELMDSKKRADTYHSAISRTRSVVRAEPGEKGTPATTDDEIVIVNPVTTILRGDVTDMMRKHRSDGSVDLVVGDPPYFMRVPENHSVINYIYESGGMTPRFRADWDEFPTLATYEAFCERWLTEAVRCLDKRGSIFICCSHFSVGPISRMLQAMGLNVVQHIQIVCLNGRPLVKPRLLQHSHFTLVWATKDDSDYRFNGHQAKRAHWPNDPVSESGRMMRDIWFIANAGYENKTGFPAQKPIELYDRILTMCGRPGGTMLDVFAGSGTGAVAALRWGMKSISIERDSGYIDDIVERLRVERKAK